jgi:hypothetical protein
MTHSKYSIMLLALLFCFYHKGAAQYFAQNSYYEFSVSTSGKQSAGALAWNHLHGIGKNKRFKLGYGVRFTGNFGRAADFITAPARLTSTTTGPLVIFSDNKPENFDTLHFSSYQINSLNISIHLNYAITAKLDAEFNIDAVGFSFGGAYTAAYNSSKRAQSPDQNTQQKARPTAFNALLTSDNDLGSLNSEIFLRYRIKPQWAVKAGASFIFTEYTTDRKLFLDNNRFRNKALMAMIGVSFCPLHE